MNAQRRLLLAVTIGVVGVVCGVGALVRAAQDGQSGRPIFRADVDVVQLDVTVLDRSRKPVRGLTASDFTVLEEGRAQRIVSVTPVELPVAAAPTTAWMRDVAPDVVRNDGDVGRVITIVFDDANTGHNGAYWDPWISGTGKRIAHAVVDGLGPADRAAVTFTFLGRSQNFTVDRSRLNAAIDAFAPKDSPSAGPPLGCSFKGQVNCVLDTLEHVAAALPAVPPRRKVIVFLSAGNMLPGLSPGDGDVVGRSSITDTVRLFRTLQRANVTLYAFSPHGLQIRGAHSQGADDALRTLAEQTGGRATVQTNTPWDAVPAMLEETRSYYLVAFQSAHRDGKFHSLKVNVARPDLDVRTRTGYVAGDSDRALARRKTPPAMAPLEAAMSAGFPEATVPLATSVAAFAVPGQRDASVVVVSRISPPTPDDASARTVAFRTTALDDNWNDRATDRQTVAMMPATTGTARMSGEVQSTLRLRPGRYEVRVAAETGGQTGSLFTDVEIPDVSKPSLSLSGVVVGHPVGAAASGAPALLRLPVQPTASRTFQRSDAVAAFLRAYQGGRSALVPVSVRTTILDEHGVARDDATRTLTPAQFAGDRAADIRVDLPLARLDPGEYLLTVEVTRADRCLPATVRFRVD